MLVILLESDEGSHTDPQSIKTTLEVSKSLGVSEKTVTRLRKRFVEEGLEAALLRKKHSRTKPRKMTGDQEAHLVALCCSAPPEGRSRWTLKLLSSRLVQLEIIENISPATVGRVLKKMNLSHGRSGSGVFQKPMPSLFGKWKTS
jgi:transposase